MTNGELSFLSAFDGRAAFTLRDGTPLPTAAGSNDSANQGGALR